MSKPHFVSAELLKDGTVRLIDDESEEFHVEMRRDMAWPLVSRRVRRFEMWEGIEKRRQKPAPVPPPSKPRLVK